MKRLLVITLFFNSICAFTSCALLERIAQRANRSINATVLAITAPNGRFENTTVIAEGEEYWTGGLKADGWTVVPPLSTEYTWSAEIVTNEESVSGVRSNALKLTNSINNRDDTSGAYAVQVYTTFEGMSAGMYRVEARIKCDWDENQTGSAQFMVECLDNNGAVIFIDYPGQPGVTSDQFKPGELKTTDKNIWDDYQAVRSPRSDHVQYQYFTAPVGTTSFRLYCWFLAVGSVWFDNITVTKTDIGVQAFFKSDRVFLYPDEKGGNVEITLLQTNVNRNNNFSVDFVLYDGEYYDEDGKRIGTVTGEYNRAVIAPGTGIIDEKVGVSFAGGQYPIARYTYDISLLEKQKHKYTLVATVWRNSGGNKTQIDLFKQNLYVYPRPNNIVYDADGKFSHFEMDGKVFNPIIGFGATELIGGGSIPAGGVFAAAKEAGINVVQTYDARVWEPDINFYNAREEISKHGLKALVCLTQNHTPTKDQRERIIKDLANNPDVFAWQIEDEPMGIVEINPIRQVMENMKLLLEEKYREVRDVDDRAVYIVDGIWNNNTHESIKYCDVLDIDHYPPDSPTTVVTRSITAATAAAAAAGGIRPVLYLTGSYYFQWENSRGNLPPTANVIRNNIYRGLEAGAKGVGYYQLHESFIYGTSIMQIEKILALWDTDLWMPICTINHVEAPLLYDLFVNGKAAVLQQNGAGNERTSLFIRQWISQTDGKIYLLAHNRSMNNTRANINLKNASGNPIGAYTAKPIGLTTLSKPDSISGTNNINLALGPEEIVLFEIE